MIVAAAVVLLLSVGVIDPALSAALAPLAVLLGVGAGFVWQRRRIITAKKEGDWCRGCGVGVSADVRREHAAADDGPSSAPYLLAAALLASTVVYGVSVYDSLPDPYPAHLDAVGQPTRWAVKSYGEVLLLPLVGLAVTAFLAILSWWLPRRADRKLPDGNALAAAARREEARRAMLVMFRNLSLVLAVGISLLSVMWWQGLWGPPLGLASGVFILAILLALTIPTLSAARKLREVDARTATGVDRESPDDDSHWWLGMVYVNRSDPSLWIPYRTGIGMTINLGHPAGIAIMGACLLLLCWSVWSS